METLALELIVQILQNLSDRDLCQAFQSCQLLNSASKCEMLWKARCLFYNGNAHEFKEPHESYRNFQQKLQAFGNKFWKIQLTLSYEDQMCFIVPNLIFAVRTNQLDIFRWIYSYKRINENVLNKITATALIYGSLTILDYMQSQGLYLLEPILNRVKLSQDRIIYHTLSEELICRSYRYVPNNPVGLQISAPYDLYDVLQIIWQIDNVPSFDWLLKNKREDMDISYDNIGYSTCKYGAVNIMKYWHNTGFRFGDYIWDFTIPRLNVVKCCIELGYSIPDNIVERTLSNVIMAMKTHMGHIQKYFTTKNCIIGLEFSKEQGYNLDRSHQQLIHNIDHDELTQYYENQL